MKYKRILERKIPNKSIFPFIFLIFIFILLLSFFLFYSSINLYGNNYRSGNEERILFFSSAITILENGQINIHETIVVECLNLEIKHGIYRDLPIYENTKSFFPKPLGLKIIDGRLDGNFAIAKKEQKNGFLRIYLGNPDTYIDNGIHTFEIIYSYDSIIKSLEGEEILYLNITGNDWSFPILKTTATISFPESLIINPDFIFTTIEAYTGAMGETDKNYSFNYIKTSDSHESDTLFFETTDILQKQEGLTVFIKWKPAFFISQQIKSTDKTGFALKKIKSLYNSNPSAFFLFFGTIVIFIYYLICWVAVGRDPEKMKLPPSTNIIEQLSPAAIRYIWKMGFDTQCLSTALISIASKGYFTFDLSNDGFLLNKTGNEANLSSDEKEVLDLLFKEDSKSYNFTRSNYRKNQNIIKKLKENLSKNYKNIYFVTNSIYYIIGLIVSILIFVISMIKTISTFEAGFILLWLIIWNFAVYGLVSATIHQWKTKKISRIFVALLLTLFSIIFMVADLAVLAIFFSFAGSRILLLNLIFGSLLLIINLIYFKLLKRPTNEGVAIYEEIEALKRFLLDIPKDLQNKNKELNLQQEMDKLLPYALALDLEKDWFSVILEPLASSDYNNHDHRYYYPPTFATWISTNNSNNIKNFSDIKSFFSYLTSTISSSSASPSSSSSTGGSSGGGSGGGGGGGW